MGFTLEKRNGIEGYQSLLSSTGQGFALVEPMVLEAHTGVPVSLPCIENEQWQNPLFFSIEVDDLTSLLDRLNGFNVHILKAPTLMPWGATVAFIQDLQSGLCFEVMQKTHKSIK